MMELKIQGKEYKIKFGFNSFCDTDLMDRVRSLATMFDNTGAESDADVEAFGKLKELFQVVRELIYVGCKKYNPVESLEAVGDLLDDYMDEGTDEDRGLMHLFEDLSGELLNEGFLADVLTTGKETEENAIEPQDHKKKQ